MYYDDFTYTNHGNTTFDFTPSFKNPDDTPEYVSIYDRPKRGRPKGTCKFSDEERRERARLSSKKYYDMNIEKERTRKREYARNKTKK